MALRDRYDLAGLDGDYRGMEEVYGDLEALNWFFGGSLMTTDDYPPID